MPKFANVHLVMNSRDRTLPGGSGVYNNFNLTNPGQNIVQGQMKDIALSEVMFPYDIPNIQAGYNVFELEAVDESPSFLTITITPGFYTGTELASAINDAIEAAAAANVPPIALTDIPVCNYSAVSNLFTFSSPATPTSPTWNDWVLYSPYTFPDGFIGNKPPSVGKDILSIMGFNGSYQEPLISGTLISYASAPLTFTQYIDICSPKLCQYQYLRDGSTTSLPRRVDLICRLYIADEISLPASQTVGARPFVIHRQFKNQRVMRNTAANAINDVDIQLYDDCGQPLTTTWAPRDFQITFHVYESGDRESDANIGYRY